MRRSFRILIAAALTLGTGLSACSRQDSVFSSGGPSKPPTTVTTGTVNKFQAADTGETSTTTISLKVNGGHLPKISSAVFQGPFNFAGSGTFPGVGGTCNPNGLVDRCTIALEFKPTSRGIFTGAVQVSYESSPGTVTSWSTSISANTPAIISAQGSGTLDFGTSYVGQPAVAQYITLEHLGGGTASNFQVSSTPSTIMFEGNDVFPGNTGTCTPTMSSGSCTIAVAVRAETSGQISQPFIISYDDGRQRQSITLQATGAVRIPPELRLLPATQDIGQVFVGASGNIPLTVEYVKGDVAATGLAFLGISGEMSFPGGTYPGTGGTCGNQIASGTCTLNLTVTPTTAGAQTRTLSLLFRSGNQWISTTAQFSFTAIKPAALAANPSPVVFPAVAAGTKSTQTVTIQHVDGPLAASSIQASFTTGFGFRDGTFPGTGGTCTTTINPGESCTLELEFSPTSQGTFSGNLVLTYSGGLPTSKATIPLSGSTPARLQMVADSVIQSTPVTVGGSATVSVTITHQGGGPATQLTPSLTSSGVYSITASTCGSTLASGSCTMSVKFQPIMAGTETAQLRLQFDNGGSSDSVSTTLSMSAVNPPTISSSPSSLDFGSISIGTTSSLSLQLSLPASAGSSISAMTITAPAAPFTITANACGRTLSPGQSCSVTIRAGPTSAGSFQPNLNISYSDGAQTRSLQVPLRVTGLSTAVLSHNPSTTLDFGSVGIGNTSSVQTWQLQHSSGQVAAISITATLPTGFSFAGGTYPGSGGTCGSTLDVGASCTISVVFAPTTGGSFAGNVSIRYSNGATFVTVNRAVAGTSNSILTLPASKSYGTIAVGSTSSATITLTLSGTGGVTAMSGSISGTGFRFTGGNYPGTGGTCGSSLSSGTCTMAVEFNPTASGSYIGSLQVNYDNGQAMSTSMSLGGTGGTATLTLPTSKAYGTIAVGATASATITATLSGTGSVNSMSGSISGGSSAYRFVGGNYPGTGGTCGSSLSSGSCTMVVEFIPPSNTSYTGTLLMNYNNGSATSTSMSLTGSGGSTASLQITGTTSITPMKVTGTTTNFNLTLTNSVGASATSMSAAALTSPFTFKGGSYPGTGGTCSTSLSSGSSCTLVLSYSPSSAGNHSSSVTINYNNGLAAAQVSTTVSGSAGTAASLTASASSIAFGQVAVSQSSTQQLTFQNSASAVPATNFRFANLSSPISITTDECTPLSGGLSASSSCSISVRFLPTTNARYAQTLTLTYNNGSSDVAMSFAISGRTPAAYSITPGDIDVGDKASGATHLFSYTITRSGGPTSTSLQAAITSSSGVGTLAFAGGAFPGTSGTCTNPMTADTCTVVLAFNLTSVGSFSGTWSATADTGAGNSTISRTLTGQSKTRASLDLSDHVLTLPAASPGSTSQVALVVSNLGTLPLTSLTGSITSSTGSVFRFPGGAFPGLGGSCQSSLTGLQSCTVVVEYAPTSTATVTGTLTIQGNDGVSAVSDNVALQHASSGGVSGKPELASVDLSRPRRWAIRDLDGDGLWDQLWFPSTDSQVMIIIGSAHDSEIGRMSLEDAMTLIRSN